MYIVPTWEVIYIWKNFYIMEFEDDDRCWLEELNDL